MKKVGLTYPAWQVNAVPLMALQVLTPVPQIEQAAAFERERGWYCPAGQLSQVFISLLDTELRYLQQKE